MQRFLFLQALMMMGVSAWAESDYDVAVRRINAERGYGEPVSAVTEMAQMMPGLIVLVISVMITLGLLVLPFLVYDLRKQVRSLRLAAESARLEEAMQQAAELEQLQIIARSLRGVEIDRG